MSKFEEQERTTQTTSSNNKRVKGEEIRIDRVCNGIKTKQQNQKRTIQREHTTVRVCVY